MKKKTNTALPQPLEKVIQRQCLEYLRLCGISCWRFNSGSMVVTGGHARRYVRFTTARGCSDLIGILPPTGRMLAVEAKREGNSPTALQSAWLNEVREQGGLALCVHSVEDLRQQLREEGYQVP